MRRRLTVVTGLSYVNMHSAIKTGDKKHRTDFEMRSTLNLNRRQLLVQLEAMTRKPSLCRNERSRGRTRDPLFSTSAGRCCCHVSQSLTGFQRMATMSVLVMTAATWLEPAIVRIVSS